MPPGARERDFADLAGIEVLLFGLNIVFAGALLHAHLADAVVHARGLDHQRSLFRREGEGLFAVHVFPGVQRVDGDGDVPVIGRGDEHDVHVLVGQKFLVIGIGLRLGRVRQGAVQVRLVDVAQRDHLDVGVLLEIAHVAGAAVAHADHSQAQLFIGSHDAGIGKRGGRAGATQEITAVESKRRHLTPKLSRIARSYKKS